MKFQSETTTILHIVKRGKPSGMVAVQIRPQYECSRAEDIFINVLGVGSCFSPYKKGYVCNEVQGELFKKLFENRFEWHAGFHPYAYLRHLPTGELYTYRNAIDAIESGQLLVASFLSKVDHG